LEEIILQSTANIDETNPERLPRPTRIIRFLHKANETTERLSFKRINKSFLGGGTNRYSKSSEANGIVVEGGSKEIELLLNVPVFE